MTYLQKARFMALRFSGRCSSTWVTAVAGWLIERVVKGAVGPPEDMALMALIPGSHTLLSVELREEMKE